MPGKNGTGPLGAGPMTGRAMGNCVDAAGRGDTHMVGGRGPCGRGLGRRGGAGRGGGGGAGRGGGGMRLGWGGTPAGAVAEPTTDKQQLAGQAELLQAQLDAIKKQLESM